MLTKKTIFLYAILVLIIFAIFFSLLPSIKNTFEYNFDEGTNLIKSSLILKGYPLYEKIIDDQPPLFMIILSCWLKFFGVNISNGRILVLLFSFLLLYAFYGTIKIQQGKFCALTGVFFLILSNLYLKTSISLMIDIPALATAMLSIYYLTLFKKLYLKKFLIISGLLFAISLQIKLYALFLMPLMLFDILKKKPDFLVSKKQNNLYILTIWLTSFLILYVPINLLFFNFDFLKIYQYLIYPHAKKLNYTGDNFKIILKNIIKDYDFFLLALIGCLLIIKQKLRENIFPVLWLALATLILMKHSPVWNHYYLLISIPICWLAAIAFNYFFQNIIKNGWVYKNPKGTNNKKIINCMISILLILTILGIPIKYYRMIKSINIKTTQKQKEILTALSKHKNNTHWIFTDWPIFSFYSDMIVPPELALIAHKRAFNDLSESEYLITKLKEYNPELILIGRKEFFHPRIFSYINKEYLEFPITESTVSSNKDFEWISRYIYWSPKWFRFLNKVWCYKLPALKGGYYIYKKIKKNYTPINFYIRKDIL